MVYLGHRSLIRRGRRRRLWSLAAINARQNKEWIRSLQLFFSRRSSSFMHKEEEKEDGHEKTERKKRNFALVGKKPKNKFFPSAFFPFHSLFLFHPYFFLAAKTDSDLGVMRGMPKNSSSSSSSLATSKAS